MASVLAGFRPVKHISGAPYNGQFNRYMKAVGDTTVLNVGDLVILGSEAAVLDPVTGGVFPTVTRATSTTSSAIVGAVVGFEPNYSNLNAGMYSPSGATDGRRIVFVADDPELLFAAPQDGDGGVIAAASVGLNCSLTIGTASSATPYASTMSVDSSEVATTATDPVQIMGIVASPDNDITSTSRPAELLVRINTHAFKAAGLAGV